MKFQVNWKVFDVSDEGTRQIAGGTVVKEAADADAINTLIDFELRPLLRRSYPDTAYSNREYNIQFTEMR